MFFDLLSTPSLKLAGKLRTVPCCGCSDEYTHILLVRRNKELQGWGFYSNTRCPARGRVSCPVQASAAVLTSRAVSAAAMYLLGLGKGKLYHLGNRCFNNLNPHNLRSYQYHLVDRWWYLLLWTSLITHHNPRWLATSSSVVAITLPTPLFRAPNHPFHAYLFIFQFPSWCNKGRLSFCLIFKLDYSVRSAARLECVIQSHLVEP